MNKEKQETKDSGRQLNHYGMFRFTGWHWDQTTEERKTFLESLAGDLSRLGERAYVYNIYPARHEADLMIWSALKADDPGAAGDFFACFASTTSRWRKNLEPVDVLWGFTRPSVYASGKSSQVLDPFGSSPPGPYVVMYPFSKTVEWFLMSQESRQGMMNEHIRVGRQFPEINQLLLYSTGLQDQEFVVVYETENLAYFSELVTKLRDTEARRYTLRDTPIYTAIHRPVEKLVDEWT